MIINKSRFILGLCFTLLWMGIIFSLSSQPSNQSDETSLGIGRIIAEIVKPDFEQISADEQDQLVESWNHAIRKTAHFAEYAILGVFCGFMVLQVSISIKKGWILAVIMCMLYAISDEVHQYFVPGRACQVGDICIDTFGAVCGVIVVVFIRNLWDWKGSHKNSEKSALL
ncbi:MAG: VanZ family protein [Schaedlerella sp.]|nr:VanZ family protein [Schaedlerella sp.]